MALAADPIASLIDIVFIGLVEIAAVGVSIALFNQVSKVAIFPLVSITTSFVAEEETIERMNNKAIEVENTKNDYVNKERKQETTLDDEQTESSIGDGSKTMMCKHTTTIDRVPNTQKLRKAKRNIPSATTALLFGLVIGVLKTLMFVFLVKPLLSLMGLKSGSRMLKPALKYLTLRSLGAPEVLLSLAMQGVFRGFKDTQTPLYATGLLLLFKVIAATIPVTLSASLAARLGAMPMAAFQICLQFVAGTQPINSIAFVFDGVNFGGSDFAYSAYSMILVSIVTTGSLFGLYKAIGFIGIWLTLTIFMGLRAIVGVWR
ncbi:hypothetical protein Ccrd_021058 [Cynara cardunculus var. scolymus]|uniref:Uncharacterized protein n=1 Tax=Cynara cardunculus var. scolymus TaxID=59895 RepID=A0A103Y195_CYNCS|nr:hypothetical protein Ccrd_021058 [Cynara cardunculus var. scolymus]